MVKGLDNIPHEDQLNALGDWTIRTDLEVYSDFLAVFKGCYMEERLDLCLVMEGRIQQ